MIMESPGPANAESPPLPNGTAAESPPANDDNRSEPDIGSAPATDPSNGAAEDRIGSDTEADLANGEAAEIQNGSPPVADPPPVTEVEEIGVPPERELPVAEGAALGGVGSQTFTLRELLNELKEGETGAEEGEDAGDAVGDRGSSFRCNSAMGASQSRDDLDLSSVSSSDAEDDDPHSSQPPSLDAKLSSLTLNPSPSSSSPSPSPSAFKLYLHVGGSSPSARWALSDTPTSYTFLKSNDDYDSDGSAPGPWILKFGSKVRAEVSPSMQLKPLPDQRRVDFVAGGVWAVRFPTPDSFRRFLTEYQHCLFENTYNVEDTDDNRSKVFGKDFVSWAKPESADDSIWEDADDSFQNPSVAASPSTPSDGLLEESEEVASEGEIQSLAHGALEHSFLVGDSGVQVVKNYSHGLHGKGNSGRFGSGSGGGYSTPSPQKALLMKRESYMLLMSPAGGGPHSVGVHQLDIEVGKVVAEWKFEKDGTDITMRDIANDSKGAQLDPSESTFLGLDDNRLCRWDMRDRRGIVQNVASSAESHVLQWSEGHQFNRGTNFQCFATTGDGSIVVGSLDGKIRLYSKNSMRIAKTAFPGLGSPITHVDVTFDGKWILGTTDTYLILISTFFKDKDGKEKTGFSARMGSQIAAPRLLKLTPLDSHMAGSNNKFHGGQFSWVTENGKQERHLVATVGKYSIIWNFQLVKNSNHACYRNQDGLKSGYCYKIVPKDESIIDSRSCMTSLPRATPLKLRWWSLLQ